MENSLGDYNSEEDVIQNLTGHVAQLLFEREVLVLNSKGQVFAFNMETDEKEIIENFLIRLLEYGHGKHLKMEMFFQHQQHGF